MAIPKLYIMAIDDLLRFFDSLVLVVAFDDLFRALYVALVDKTDAVGRHERRSGCAIRAGARHSQPPTEVVPVV